MIPLVKTMMAAREKMIPEIEKILYSGYVAQGIQVEAFERAFEQFIGGGNALSLNSGTSALHISLILAGISPGEEVISTALTAEPTNVAIKMCGAKIRYADIDYQTGNIDPESIETCINPSTRAIMVVDYAGIPVNVPVIQELARRYHLPVIHDCAHSLGARFDGIKSGNHFSRSIFSFQAIKHLTTVDGGILLLADWDDYEKGKLIRWFGIDKRQSRLENNIQIQGYKYHMNNVNATIGLVNLSEIDTHIAAHIDNGKYYDRELRHIPGVELIQYYQGSEPSYWLYTLKVENRNGFIARLHEKGIMASELHKRNDHHQYLNDFHQELPMLDAFYPKLVHLPCGSWVSTEEREYITQTIKEGW